MLGCLTTWEGDERLWEIGVFLWTRGACCIHHDNFSQFYDFSCAFVVVDDSLCTSQSETATKTGEKPPLTQSCLVICSFLSRNLPISFPGNKVNYFLSPFVGCKLVSSSKDPLFGQELASSLGHDPAITFETYKSTWSQTWWLQVVVRRKVLKDV